MLPSTRRMALALQVAQYVRAPAGAPQQMHAHHDLRVPKLQMKCGPDVDPVQLLLAEDFVGLLRGWTGEGVQRVVRSYNDCELGKVIYEEPEPTVETLQSVSLILNSPTLHEPKATERLDVRSGDVAKDQEHDEWAHALIPVHAEVVVLKPCLTDQVDHDGFVDDEIT